MSDKISCIYIIKCTGNDKVYIGQTISHRKRIEHHKYSLRHNKHRNSYLQNSYNKYGINSFEYEILELCKIEDLDKRERYWISHYNSNDREFGFNLDGGGNSNKKLSEETKKKISLKSKGRAGYWTGKKRDEETKKKISASSIGKEISEETRMKISKKSKGKKHTEETKQYLRIINTGENSPSYGKKGYWTGKKFSEEHIRRISEAKQGEKNNRYGTKHTEETKQKISDSQPTKIKITEEMIMDKLNGMPRKDWMAKYGYSQRIWDKIKIKEGTV